MSLPECMATNISGRCLARLPTKYRYCKSLSQLVCIVLLCTFNSVISTSFPPNGGSSGAATSTTTSSSTGLPRSQSLSHKNYYDPPWNPSARIDAVGFLQGQYIRTPGEWEDEVRLKTRYTLSQPCRIRQVPGDGNCLFHSLSLCLGHAVNGTHWNIQPTSLSTSTSSTTTTATATTTPTAGDTHQGDVFSHDAYLEDLYVHSRVLRAQAVACLRDWRRHLVLQGREWLTSLDLVESAAQQYGLTPDEYCDSMLEESVWGGGPEIVALCNMLQRPIHVYELATSASTSPTLTTTTAEDGTALVPDNQHTRLFSSFKGSSSSSTFVLRRMACFGSPRFDRKEALHILSADSRFPDIRPGQQLTSGNHFLAIFPIDDSTCQNRNSRNRQRRKQIRGGGDSSSVTEEVESSFLRRLAAPYVEWWRDLIGSCR